MVSLLAALALAFTSQPASLRFAGLHPLAVTGHGFAHGEGVRVSAHAGSLASTLRTTAGAHGSFRATFPKLSLTRCDPLVVRAVGDRGHVATLHTAAPACEARAFTAASPP